MNDDKKWKIRVFRHMGTEFFKHIQSGYGSNDFYFRKAKLSYELSKKELLEWLKNAKKNNN